MNAHLKKTQKKLHGSHTETSSNQQTESAGQPCKDMANRQYFYFSFPSPAIKSVISSIFSSGNGGNATGFIAIDISFMGLSSAATRLDESTPHLRQR